ncbi:MAG TPA: xanthine dehydrogenase family protein molybdopterin-binding subunit [Blastococcus sp.]
MTTATPVVAQGGHGAGLPGGHSVGRSIPRADLHAKLTGAAQFGADLTVPGMLHVKVLRSVVAHARIVVIDDSDALAVPGVVSVTTAQDLRDMDAQWGHFLRDRPIFADGVVRFVGEIVAAVAAETEAAALAGVHALDVEYEELPAVVDIASAVAPAAPRVHDGPARPGYACPPGTVLDDDNAFYHYRVDYRRTDGDGDGDGDEQGLVVVEDEYVFPAVYQYAMEPHAVIAEHGPDGITVHSTCQHPFQVRQELSVVFGLPVEQVRVVVPFLGGGFGSKSYTKLEPVAVAVARHTGRPVRLVNLVEDAMVTSRRHGMRCRMRTVARPDGQLVAREAEVLLDTGAYADNGPTVTMVAALAAVGPYRWEVVAVDAACVYTHLPPSGSYRGFGAAHMQWVGESQVDEIARRLGIDRLALRRQNLLHRGETFVPGQKPIDADLIGDLDAVARRLDWGAPLPEWEGRGVSIGLSPGGAVPQSEARVELGTDGTVLVFVGSTEMGQGPRTVHAQIAAEVLGLAPDRVTVVPTDTDTTPYDRSTGASRSTTVAGLAVQRASEDLLSRLRTAAGLRSEDQVQRLWLEGDRLRTEDREWRLDGLAADVSARPGEALFTGVGDAGELLGGTPVFWEVCLAGAEVAVEPDTGEITVRRVVTAADVGRAMNPSLVERQDEGCAMQALGNALFEEMHFSETGALINDSLLDYRVPTVADLPDMECILIENGDGPGPFGAKGCGEGVFGGLTGALVTAVEDAGVRVRELPMTAGRMWRAIRDADPAPAA